MKPQRGGRVRCSAWLGRALSYLFVVVINLLLCGLCHGERLAEVCANLRWCPKATVKLANEMSCVNNVNVQRLNLASVLHGKLGEVLPVFDSNPHCKLSNLSALIAASGQPQIDGGDAATDNRSDGGAQNSGGGYIELHDWLMIMGGWIFGIALGNGVVIWWCVRRPNETSSAARPEGGAK